MTLGVIGGFAGLVWQFFGLITGDYEEFKKNVSLLKSFYTVDDNILDSNYVGDKIIKSVIGSEGPDDTLNNNMKKKVYSHSEYEYNYVNTLEALLYKIICCCCKTERSKRAFRRQKLHEEGVQRMLNELDIVGLIRKLRKLNLLANTKLKDH
jgi:hypothetical protein